MSKEVLLAVKQAVQFRDGDNCALCQSPKRLLLHFILPDTNFYNGGFIEENAILLCFRCEIKARAYHTGYVIEKGYSPEDLYNRIGSSERIVFDLDREGG